MGVVFFRVLDAGLFCSSRKPFYGTPLFDSGQSSTASQPFALLRLNSVRPVACPPTARTHTPMHVPLIKPLCPRDQRS